MKGVRSVEFDTTGNGYIKTKKGYQLTNDAVAKAIKKVRGVKLSVRKLEQVELPKPQAKYELTVAGVS